MSMYQMSNARLRFIPRISWSQLKCCNLLNYNNFNHIMLFVERLADPKINVNSPSSETGH